MLFKHAKRLHNEDEVTIKKTGRIMQVVETKVDHDTKQVEIMCEDGNWYNHKEVS